MLIRVCPECYKAFYAAEDDSCAACSCCGHLFCERRSQERTRALINISFSLNGSHTPCVATDYSEDGAGIVYRGGHIDEDTVLAICTVDGARRPARAVWVRKMSNAIVSAGLRLL